MEAEESNWIWTQSGKYLWPATVTILLTLVMALFYSQSFVSLVSSSDSRPTEFIDLRQNLYYPTEKEVFGLSWAPQNKYFFCLGFEANCGYHCVWNFTCIWSRTHNSSYRAVCWAREIQPSPVRFSENAIREKLLTSPCQINKRPFRVWMVIEVYDQMVDLSFNLVHYLALGFDHFLIYDENTTGTAMEEMLSPFIKLGFVTYTRVLTRRSQGGSYRDGHQRSKGFAEWVLYADVDELFYDFEHRCIHEILSTVPKNASVLSINRLEIPPSLAFGGRELGHTYFSRIAFSSFGLVGHAVKSFCQPNRSNLTHVHYCTPHRPYLQINSNFLNMSGFATIIEHASMVVIHFRGGDFYEYVLKRLRGGGDAGRAWDNNTLNGFVETIMGQFYINRDGKLHPPFPWIYATTMPRFEAFARNLHQLYLDLLER